MKKKLITFTLLFFPLFVLTACWDNMELNDRAIIHGLALDVTDDGQYKVSAQIVRPSSLAGNESGGGKGEQFFVISATGEATYDAFQALQNKTSRELNRGHRQTVYIGESLARQGIESILDVFTRDPESRMIGDITVIKGRKAMDAIEVFDPLESTSALATVKIHERINETADTLLLNFLRISSSDSMSPSPFALDINKENNTIQSVGSAVFNKDLQLVGFLDEEETNQKLWINERLKYHNFFADFEQGKGKIHVRARDLSSKIQPEFNGDDVTFRITLSGKGEIKQNYTNMDLTNADEVDKAQKELEKTLEKDITQLLEKVQKEFGTDIFGFGETIHRKYPSKWKNFKKDWEQVFSEAAISVKVELPIEIIGLTGASRKYIEEKENKE